MRQRYWGWRAAALAVVSGALGAALGNAPAQAQCVGDCNGDEMVAINELITGVNIALGSANVSACASVDINGDGEVAINELITSVNNALAGCPVVDTPTPVVDTPTPQVDTPTPQVDTPTPEADTPTPTATSEPTVEPTAGPIGKVTCNLGTGSQLLLQTASLPLALVPTGTASIECGTPDADGVAACACEVGAIDPLVIPAIGDVCINPAAGCPSGEVDCDGGSPLDVDLNATHHIGTCTANAECADACDAYCAALGAGYSRLSYGCEGYCQGGERNEMECAADTDCPGAQCPGRDPVAHPDVCGCVCAANGIGEPGRPGALNCTLGTQINVELPSNGSCGDTATIQLAPVCGGLTTETSTGVVNYANNDPNATIPAAGPESIEGANLSCDTLRAQTTTGLKLVGQLGFFDSTLGDIRSRNTFVCQ